MMSLTLEQYGALIVSLAMLSYAFKVVTYAASDRIHSVSTRMLNLVCQWQSKRLCPSKNEFALEPINIPQVEFIDSEKDPKWRELYVPTYQRLGRKLSMDQ